jgi:hypothetical protein
MTLQEILDTLQNTMQQLEDAGVNDTNKRDLRRVITRLKIALEGAVFDPLRELDSVQVPDTSQLKALAVQVQQEIDNEKARVALVQKLVAVSKKVIRAAGVPLPV